ncbi:MAG: D-alanyl-D-alanine carboxypeptidase [Coleofasciculus sp.]
MKPMNPWQKQSLAMLTVGVMAMGNVMTPSIARATTAANLTKSADSIEIFVPPPERRTSGVCPDFLGLYIDSIINRPNLAGGKWGIVVESVSNPGISYSHNANQFLIPASNNKLFTTAAALQRLDSRALIQSKSLDEWVTVTNQRSSNSYADSLLRYIGGPSAVKQILAPLGVDPNGFRQVDGSGLSRQNVATPQALIATLKAMMYANGNDLFYRSLPVAGVNGTLRNRLRLPETQGRIRAKTGTLRGVRSLSGYLEHPYYGTILFSIMVNQPSQSGQVLVGAIDEIALRLAQLTPCQ